VKINIQIVDEPNGANIACHDHCRVGINVILTAAVDIKRIRKGSAAEEYRHRRHEHKRTKSGVLH
jgi:hypothetical protein